MCGRNRSELLCGRAVDLRVKASQGVVSQLMMLVLSLLVPTLLPEDMFGSFFAHHCNPSGPIACRHAWRTQHHIACVEH